MRINLEWVKFSLLGDSSTQQNYKKPFEKDNKVDIKK